MTDLGIGVTLLCLPNDRYWKIGSGCFFYVYLPFSTTVTFAYFDTRSKATFCHFPSASVTRAWRQLACRMPSVWAQALGKVSAYECTSVPQTALQISGIHQAKKSRLDHLFFTDGPDLGCLRNTGYAFFERWNKRSQKLNLHLEQNSRAGYKI